MSDWQLCREEWDEHRKMVAKLHDVIVGTTESPGYLEMLRRQIERIDRHDKRLGYHQVAIDKIEGDLADLQDAPARAAVAELAEIKADDKDLKRSIGKRALDLVSQGLVAVIAALVTFFGAAWSGLMKLAQNVPPGPTPGP